MLKKCTPCKGHTITIQIIIPCNADFKVETDNEESKELTKAPTQTQLEGVYTLTRSNGKTVTIKSMRQLRLFDYLQGREQSYTSGIELAEVMGMRRNQALDSLSELKAKGLVYYTHEGTRIKIIRVDDIALLQPSYNGVDNESESSCETH